MVLQHNYRIIVCLIIYVAVISPTRALAEKAPQFSTKLIIAMGLFNDGLYRLAIDELESDAIGEIIMGEGCTLNLLLGKSYFLLERYGDSLSPLNNVLDNNCSFESQEEAYYYLGNIHSNLGERSEAKRNFERLQFLYPESKFIPETREELGKILYLESLDLFYEENYSKALIGFKKVLSLHLKSVPQGELLAEMGDTFYYLGEYDKAEDAYEKAAALYIEGDAKGRIIFQLAMVSYNLGKYENAISAMKSFLDEYQGHTLSSRARSVILRSIYKEERYEDALTYLHEMEKHESDVAEKEINGIVGSATRLLAIGEYVNAVAYLEEALGSLGEDPLRGDIMLLLAKAYKGAGIDTMAEKTYSEIVKRYPSSKAALDSSYRLGKINFKRGYSKKAAEHFKLFIEKNPLGPRAHDAISYLAESLFMMGDLDGAKEQFASLTANFGDSDHLYEAYSRLADIDMLTGRYLDAAVGYSSALKKFPGRDKEGELLWKFAEALRKGIDIKSAVKAYIKYIKAYPDGKRVVAANAMVGDLSYYLGDYKSGIIIFKRMINSSGEGGLPATYALKLAKGYLAIKKIPYAINTLDLIIDKYPDSDEAETAYYLKGWTAQEEKKEFKNANNAYLSLLERFPDTHLKEELLWEIGNNNFMLGDYKEALKVFKELSRDYPESHRDGNGMVVKCYTAMGDFKNALEASMIFLEVNPDRAVDLKKRYREAMALFEVGSYHDAISLAEGVIDKFPSHTLSPKLMVMAGESYIREGNPGKALKLFMMGQDYLKEGALKNLASFRLAELAIEENNFRKSLVELEKMNMSISLDDIRNKEIELFIDVAYMMAKSYYLIGEASSSLNFHERALESFKRLIDDYPDIKGLKSERLKAGLYFQKHKDYGRAISAMRQLIAMFDDIETKAEAQYWIGESYHYMGEVDRAIVEYLKVTYLYPSESMWALTARYMAAQAYQEAGKHEEAINLYRKVAEDSADKKKSEYARRRIEELLGSREGAFETLQSD